MIRKRRPQKETPGEVQGRDLFQTPYYATDIIVPYIPTPQVWEPAAGEGMMVARLRQKGFSVFASDIRSFPGNTIIDFLKVDPADPRFTITPKPSRTDTTEFFKRCINFLKRKPAPPPYTIVTNPPYSIKRKFFNKCIELGVPFALLISGDYCQWTIDAVRLHGCEKVIPTSRINYITPTGLSEANGHSSFFHSYWLTRFFNIGKSELFIELTKETRLNVS